MNSTPLLERREKTGAALEHPGVERGEDGRVDVSRQADTGGAAV